MINWFAAKKLILNVHKTNIMKFITNNSAYSILRIGYKAKYEEETVNTISWFTNWWTSKFEEPFWTNNS